MQQGSGSLSFEQALRVVRHRLPLIALCTVVVAAAAFGFSRQQTKKYTATASIVFNNNPLSQQIAGLPGNSSNLLVQQAANVELVELGDMAAFTAQRLGHGLTEESVRQSLSVGGVGESSAVVISATATSPTLAAAIANTYAARFVAEQRTANRGFYESALRVAEGQLAALPRQERFGPAGVPLQTRAQSLRFLSELKVGNVQVAQRAQPPTSPSSPKTSRNTILGGLLGLVLGLGLALLLESLDRGRLIRTPRELEALYGLSLLGCVPESSALTSPARGDGRSTLHPAEAEAFHLIRAHLRSLNPDRDPRTILVASAVSGEGSTLIARHLAEAAARLGSRVLLLEADLRRPSLRQQLRLAPGPGLTEVLLGAAFMHEAIRSVALETALGDWRSLDVLACGILPPNPGELTESSGMAAVLEQARSVYDLVVIDTRAARGRRRRLPAPARGGRRRDRRESRSQQARDGRRSTRDARRQRGGPARRGRERDRRRASRLLRLRLRISRSGRGRADPRLDQRRPSFERARPFLAGGVTRRGGGDAPMSRWPAGRSDPPSGSLPGIGSSAVAGVGRLDSRGVLLLGCLLCLLVARGRRDHAVTAAGPRRCSGCCFSRSPTELPLLQLIAFALIIRYSPARRSPLPPRSTRDR